MGFEKEGRTTVSIACFTGPAKFAEIRFRVSLVDEKLVIWIEDLRTKEQWHTKAMSVADYASTKNAIPNAQAKDYAQHFVDCLRAGVDDPAYECSLFDAYSNGTRLFALYMRAHFGPRTMLFVFNFDLRLVIVDAAMLLESRIRDLEDETRRQNQRNDVLEARMRKLVGDITDRDQPKDAVITLRAKGEAEGKRNIQWKSDGQFDSAEFEIRDHGREIQLVGGGLYVFSLSVATTKVVTYGIKVNGKVHKLGDLYPEKSHQTLTLVKLVPANALVAVVNMSSTVAPAESLLVIASV